MSNMPGELSMPQTVAPPAASGSAMRPVPTPNSSAVPLPTIAANACAHCAALATAQ
ncbi:hypothetical protein LUZ17_19000 [Xanthomonas oryzae pv. oryzae]|nr:hypothetical protein [Xanthomonas oryzae]UEG99492.1 hypothetical protein LLC55_18615 [Xanthomonas oryzae pv. oryzae]UEQ25702.1 hypothetical protein LNP58_13265 [Xanthomonas oryzae pv. oryzae]UHC73812.1 hypothetical protein LUZ17_19000 [Xanthomonas oryzae pv. oryzae]URJ84139.1 hypothetical protein M9500_15130 [Xanthomonas oryzae pv. oryzae]WDN43099.1 hypothetical protein LL925_19315 [Xanthomonas oryzae]